MLWTRRPDGGCPSSDWRKFSLRRKVETGWLVAVWRRANSKCHSSGLHNRSPSVGTLTRNQRKVDFNCCEYKVSLSCPRCCFLILFFFFFFLPRLFSSLSRAPLALVLPGGLVRIACVQNIAGGFPLCFSAAEAFVQGMALRSLLYSLLWGNYGCCLFCPLNL